MNKIIDTTRGVTRGGKGGHNCPGDESLYGGPESALNHCGGRRMSAEDAEKS